MTKRFFDYLFWLNKALAGIAGALLGFATLTIAADIIVRTIGGRPPSWTVAGSEYIMLYVTVLGAPYMVRIKGHVFVEALIMNVPAVARRVIEKFLYLLCFGISLFLAWYALGATINAFATGDFDMRGFDMPWGWIYGPMTIGFVLTALEFLRYLLGLDSMYTGDDVARDTL